ncbi:hypothetical protein BJY01DRAFT_213210 [Aspergillus pseudoustus]|uniref:Uncharacterized protein n=1 Tax=Aspergillus pseudoustus TaxID=1810923 RepID=A0ABR4K2P8_9EURO
MFAVKVDVESTSAETTAKRLRNATATKKYRQKRMNRRSEQYEERNENQEDLDDNEVRDELLTLLEFRTISFLRYGGSFRGRRAPRRLDYKDKSLQEIDRMIERVEGPLKVLILERIKSRGHIPDAGLELDVLERRLIELEKDKQSGSVQLLRD